MNALRAEIGIAPRISLRPISEAVRAAIHFDAEPSGRAIEIQHIGSDGMLPSEHWTAGFSPP